MSTTTSFSTTQVVHKQTQAHVHYNQLKSTILETHSTRTPIVVEVNASYCIVKLIKNRRLVKGVLQFVTGPAIQAPYISSHPEWLDD